MAPRSSAKMAPVSAYSLPLVAQREGLACSGRRVDVDGEHRAEQLLAHGPVVRLAGDDHGRADEVALAVVTLAAEDLDDPPALALLGLVDRLLELGVAAGVDHGAHKIAKVGDVADLQFAMPSASCSRTSGHRLSGMYAREAAEHFWP
jgi:hypothetical protein